MPRPKDPRRKCLVATQHLSHYRAGVYRELDRSGTWDFTFAGGDHTRDHSIPGISSDLLKDRRVLTETWLPGGFFWQHGLLRICVRERFEVAILGGDVRNLAVWVATMLLALRGTRVFYWTTGWHKPEQGVRLWLRRFFYALPKGLLLYGEDGYTLAIDLGMDPKRLQIIGNSHTFVSDLADAPLPTDGGTTAPQVLGAVIRLQEVKRLDLLIEAASHVRDRGHDVSVLLVGEGPARDSLEAQAKRLGVPVRFAGAVYDAHGLAEAYQEIAVTVVPEMAGLTTIQSLAYGIPVITVDDPHSQAPEYRAVVEGVTGALYRKGDITSLVETIETWLQKAKRDRRRIAIDCRSEVQENWSPTAHAQRIISGIS